MMLPPNPFMATACLAASSNASFLSWPSHISSLPVALLFILDDAG